MTESEYAFRLLQAFKEYQEKVTYLALQYTNENKKYDATQVSGIGPGTVTDSDFKK